MRKIAILIIALMMIGTGFLSGCTSDTISDDFGWDTETIQYEAERQIKERLKCPSTAQFSEQKIYFVESHGTYIVYKVVGKVDSENSFSAMIRSSFYIYLNCYPNGKYVVGEWNID